MMLYNEKQHKSVSCRVVSSLHGYFCRDQWCGGGASKVRLVQRKGEAVEGEPRTTRQAAEKGELSASIGELGDRARKRGRPRG